MYILKGFIILSFLAMLYINYLANSLPLGGISTKEISKKYQTLFTPSGFTFSIWGIIYLLVLAFVVYFVIQTPDQINMNNLKTIGILLIVVNVLNISWLFAWHHDKILLSTFIMIAFLVTLLFLVSLTSNSDLLTYATFTVYAGWISIALIANISITLLKYDIKLFTNSPSLWFYIVVGISLIIGSYMVIIKHHYFYGVVFLWAYFGIAMKFIKHK